MQFVSLCNLQNVLVICDLSRVKIKVRVRVRVRAVVSVRAKFRPEIANCACTILKLRSAFRKFRQ